MITRNDILQEALNQLDHQGWCQGDLENDDGQLCLAGAVQKASVVLFGYLFPFDKLGTQGALGDILYTKELAYVYNDTINSIVDAITEMGDTSVIPIWNDDPRTTVEDVKLILKKAKEAD